jgi:hypothetical protein
MRMKLEELAGIGFAVDIGDQNDVAKTFVGIINERCGGIHGRKIDLKTIEVAALGAAGGADASSLTQAACITAAEDYNAVFAYSGSGFGNVGVPCLTQAHEVIFITSYTFSGEDTKQAERRLYATGLSGEEQLTYMARDLAKRGALDGKVIGVVRPDLIPDADVVERGLVNVLKNELGLNVKRVDTIGCDGGVQCVNGVIPSVQGMIRDGVDVLFPALNILSLPGYLSEMVTQGVQPGDITFYNSDYAAQSADIVSGKVVEFGGDAAGKLYNGTTIISAGTTGAFRLPGYQPSEFSEMCNREYTENGNPVGGKAYSATDEATVTRYASMIGMCSMLRFIARAIDAAGPNPSRADLAKAMEGLGAIDQGGENFGSFGPGKYTAPNFLYTNKFNYPCPYPTTLKSKACVVVEGEAREQPVEPIER